MQPVPEGIRRQLSDAASVVTLPTMLVRNVGRATEAIIEIRDQLRTLVDLPREILDQMRAMQEIAERMQRTAEEIHAIAGPMLETGRAATQTAAEARDAVNRTNELIERTLRLAGPLERAQQRGERVRSRWRRG